MTDKSDIRASKQLLNRRSYIKAAAGVTGLAAFGMNGAAAESDYDVITVGAGETHRVNLSDGEVFENVLIDISARNATFQVRARANDWTIRNIGVKGHWDGTQNSVHPFVLEVPDSNATGTVENVHFGTTTESDADYGNGPGGPYVFPGHAGHITFDRVWLQHFQDNGIYASPPGLPGKGAGGTITIKNCYAYRCGTSNFRIGSTGSEIRNSVSINAHRGFWGQLNDTDIYNCDFVDNTCDIAVGDSGYSTGQNATVTLHDSRWSGDEWTHASGARVEGSSAGTPTKRVPAGCPESPEAAAAGNGGKSQKTSSSAPSQSENQPEGNFTLEVTTNSEYAEYLIELDADEVTPGSASNTHDHEYQDRAFEQDGSWYVHGHLAAGGSDDFDVTNGEISRIGELQGTTQITADQTRVDPTSFDTISSVPSDEPALLNVVVFDGNGTRDTTSYEFVVSEAVEPSTDEDATIDQAAEVDGTHARGVVANYLDAWRFAGEIEQLNVNGNATVRVNGVEVDPDYFDDVS